LAVAYRRSSNATLCWRGGRSSHACEDFINVAFSPPNAALAEADPRVQVVSNLGRRTALEKCEKMQKKRKFLINFMRFWSVLAPLWVIFAPCNRAVA
jgi:hypothetical protein